MIEDVCLVLKDWGIAINALRWQLLSLGALIVGLRRVLGNSRELIDDRR